MTLNVASWNVRVLRDPSKCAHIVKYNAFVCDEKVRWFPHRYIEWVESLDGHALQSNREMPLGAFS